ncbi:MAG: transposase, partial [Akkermansia sp.]
MNNSLFPYRALISPEDNLPRRQRSIEELSQFIDFGRFRSILEKHCRRDKKSNAGRHPYDAVKMLKIIILQSLYNLSDDEMEFQLNDRISFMRF